MFGQASETIFQRSKEAILWLCRRLLTKRTLPRLAAAGGQSDLPPENYSLAVPLTGKLQLRCPRAEAWNHAGTGAAVLI